MEGGLNIANKISMNHYSNILLFFQYQAIQTNKMLVAIDWYDMKLAEHTFCLWDGYTRQQKLMEEVKIKQAKSHYNW